jgi:aspartyl aminopeptidase
MAHDVQGANLLGRDDEMISAPRLDNLCSAYCGLEALLAHLDGGDRGDAAGGGRVPVLCLFDHEEVGSGSHAGALSPVLASVLERVVLLAGGSGEDVHRAIADSFCVSADMAHATHPNYTEVHEPAHWIELNKGPVIKINTNQRYASDAEGEAVFQAACERADVPVQKYFHRSNLACGSTIGPLTAANLGMRVVDVGAPQLSMHSCRELCGSLDPALMVRALTAFLAG